MSRSNSSSSFDEFRRNSAAYVAEVLDGMSPFYSDLSSDEFPDSHTDDWSPDIKKMSTTCHGRDEFVPQRRHLTAAMRRTPTEVSFNRSGWESAALIRASSAPLQAFGIPAANNDAQLQSPEDLPCKICWLAFARPFGPYYDARPIHPQNSGDPKPHFQCPVCPARPAFQAHLNELLRLALNLFDSVSQGRNLSSDRLVDRILRPISIGSFENP